MRPFYERVLSDPQDASAWRALAEAFADAGQPDRAVACLDALDASDAGAPAPPGSSELRRAAGRLGAERRKRMAAALSAPDEARVSVLVSPCADASATERSLASVARQSLGRAACQVLVDDDRARALLEARGRYVACVDAGDELWPDHLEVLTDHLDRTGRAMTFSRALRPGPSATEGAPVLPRQASHAEFAPPSCVLLRRRELLAAGGFDPALGRGQSWHLWRRLVERFAADAVPVLSARVGDDDVSLQRRFDLLLVRRGSLARARRWQHRARGHLARGDAELAAADLARAWNFGLDVERYLGSVARIARVARTPAIRLVAHGAGEVEPHLRDDLRRVARGAQARRELALRTHRHALRLRYDEAERRGRVRAQALGWRD